MSDMTDEEFSLKHFGVKGMKWGKRKSESEPRNDSRTDSQEKQDIRTYGRKGSERINSDLNKGKALSDARKTESLRQRSAALGVGTATLIATNVTISAAHSLARSPKVLSFVGNLMENASPGAKGVAVNAFVGARTVTGLLATPQSRGLISIGASAVAGKALDTRMAGERK